MGDGKTALVLAGGGVTGIAWEIGVLDALIAAGIPVLASDLIVGTSAGSAVAAQVTSGAPMADLVARQLAPASESKERGAELDLDLLGRMFTLMVDEGRPAQERRAEIGAMALGAATISEAERLEIIAARLPNERWPEARMLLCAIDASSGELVAFDRSSGVRLVDAVAASCAVPGVWPPVTIGDRRYIDGGMRSPANADLAAGHEAVLVLSPMAAPMMPGLDAEVAALRADGSEVVVIGADDEAAAAMGPNPLDPEYRAVSVEAGQRQGAAAADAVRALFTADLRSESPR